MRNRLVVVKIGGHIVDNDAALDSALVLFSRIKGKKVLVHGGGKVATDLASELSIPQTLIEGRRVTDKETLKVATLVYGGLVNKTLTVKLQALDINAIGMTGADGNLIRAKKRAKGEIDYGFVGDVERVNGPLLKSFLEQGLTPVIAPLTHDGDGQLLNTNADTIAQEVAKSLCRDYDVTLVYGFEKIGVLLDLEDETSLLREITPSVFQHLRAEGKVFDGMIPKLENAFRAIESGVKRVCLGKAETLIDLIDGKSGTSLRADTESKQEA
ncbi:MAG: acetylglutamate kinase [Bdellovibrionales bacterium]|nr:acetylglutamate kinase [Oligoflexia bacterium]